ncbi:arginine--tRNA ligase [Candidatus Spongiihabitans sp.]|uniref:arginine--tRNA ligase n=1 Tax=Candidatus Spongiihabitans sp. TaxID=3101308 RepID=UPI003C6FE65C
MKDTVTHLLAQAVEALQKQGLLDESAAQSINVERTRDSDHGDFASNLAMKLAKQTNSNPRELAQKILAELPQSGVIEKAAIAGPGFINFHLKKNAYLSVIDRIRHKNAEFGQSDIGHGQRIMVEFVSTNPTGPLHVGHGRGAAYGDALARVLRAAGYDTHSEYYINDGGRQMDILAVSVWLRYLQRCGREIQFPENAYQGNYVRDLAAQLKDKAGKSYCIDTSKLFKALPAAKEESIDRLISRCRKHLGDKDFRVLFDVGCDAMVDDIRQDLAEFGVVFQAWFSERSLLDNGDIDKSIKTLEENGHIYEKDGAKWFRATDFGDDKDRVVLRANGVHTYFASDIAYHYNKAERGFDKIINIFGADHHGYIKRLYASFEALGNSPEKLEFLLVQFAILYRCGEKISMSTRSGEFVTLRDLRDEVGNDAARFFYVLRKPDQHMDFDLDLAKSHSSDNPVYYIQYAHARICSVFRQLEQRGMQTPETAAPKNELLKEPQELDLLKSLSRFPEVVESAASGFAPHQVAYYLRDLAHVFHTYYNAHPFLSSADDVRLARLGLIDATRIVIANGLGLLGVSAPENM